MTTRVFVPVRGQYENIGDCILRRELLEWLRVPGVEPHVYTGHSPKAFDRCTGVQPDDIQYSSLLPWMAKMLFGRRGDAYFFKPGEIQLTVFGMKEHLGLFPPIAAIRARKGRVSRVGVGARGFSRLGLAMLAPSVRISHTTYWRDEETAERVGVGQAMPDLAFGQGSDVNTVEWGHTESKEYLALSLREDFGQAPPSAEWLEGVKSAAEELGLKIIVVTQVKADIERSKSLAAQLGAEELAWPDSIGHDEQEERLRELYRRSSVTISDRLHVLVAAYTEGSAPVAPLPTLDDKIARHFNVIGLNDVVSVAMGADEVRTAILEGANRADLEAKLSDARTRLNEIRAIVMAPFMRSN